MVYEAHGLLGCDTVVWLMSTNISEKHTASTFRISTVNIKAAGFSEVVILSTKLHDLSQKSIIFSADFLTKILYANTVTSLLSFSSTYHFSNMC